MVRRPLQCVLWGYLLTAVHPETSLGCRENQFLLNNVCCDKCPPGEKLVDECTEFKETQCLRCTKGEFLDTWNRERHCYTQRYCDPNLGLQVQKEGTLETDTTCICEEGRHCTSDACEHCDLHSSCGPGFGAKQLGTGVSDTICESCPDGFFSNVSSAFEKCHPWTSCENKHLVELQAGTNVTDAVCGLQDRSRALLAIPIIIGILIAALLMSVYFRRVFSKPVTGKAIHIKVERQDPVEVADGDDFLGHNTAAPVQETLHGCQPVTQEDGKESRISVQERQ
ncbi:tumor necrosis factor receptor superfamily member 5 isoform X2 [Fukomys damarensis]|uniref:Tumor necrosis factor receptor superfamily member 5 n=1 Tax=Fukomys damarensis TaxID=885580 RepID=A0A091DMT7_FUKDA|nr:tumor necrosis factor receptor superfamily member 5 isoform X2 [Fukomys damarensis]KFO32412.1 Tumor necrosis factor receptor superfamily member 5 [Fukomys damarensis]